MPTTRASPRRPKNPAAKKSRHSNNTASQNSGAANESSAGSSESARPPRPESTSVRGPGGELSYWWYPNTKIKICKCVVCEGRVGEWSYECIWDCGCHVCSTCLDPDSAKTLEDKDKACNRVYDAGCWCQWRSEFNPEYNPIRKPKFSTLEEKESYVTARLGHFREAAVDAIASLKAGAKAASNDGAALSGRANRPQADVQHRLLQLRITDEATNTIKDKTQPGNKRKFGAIDESSTDTSSNGYKRPKIQRSLSEGDIGRLYRSYPDVDERRVHSSSAGSMLKAIEAPL